MNLNIIRRFQLLTVTRLGNLRVGVEFSFLPQVQLKMSDVEVREMEIFDWRKKVSEAECKLKQQENLLESVISERNLYSKNLIEAQVPLICSCNPRLIFSLLVIYPGRHQLACESFVDGITQIVTGLPSFIKWLKWDFGGRDLRSMAKKIGTFEATLTAISNFKLTLLSDWCDVCIWS